MYGCENPFVFATPALWPLEGPAADVLGPASGCESSETDNAESLSLSVSLIVVYSERSSEEEAGTAVSVGIKACSMDASELEGEVVRLATLCLFRARESSGSASIKLEVADGDCRMPEDDG